MKFYKFILAAMTLAVVSFGCAKDIILEPPPSLQGEYTGVYKVTSNFQQPNQTTREQDIRWVFTESQYRMNADTLSGQSQIFCEPFGRYSLGDKVDLRESSEGCAGVVANATDNPFGEFVLNRPDLNTVVLSKIESANSVFKEVRLTRVDGQ